MGIHIYVFVDDFLVIGENRELTIKGMEMLETLFNELGLQWAAHKRRGPARAMEFLGFLLVNEQGGRRLIAMSEGRHDKMLRLVQMWMGRRPSDLEESRGVEATAEPKELASLLGLLVFCAAAVPNGRTHMQGMLRQFARLEVDWTRGAVRWSGGDWGEVPLTRTFWRDLSWWRGALEENPSVPMARSPAGVAAVTGTDASDLACGELVWHDGGREEMKMVFTHAERRRPINFRELLGTYRLVERWGARLAGRTLLIDIDNSATVGAATSSFSKAEDMQELVLRLVSLAAKHNLLLRPVHTPGAMLDRPDQTSRGAALEEPRVRFRASFFKALERTHGPFDEMIGAERGFAVSTCSAEGPARLWAHPAFNTVGTALGRMCERLHPDPKTCPRGLVVVPWAPEAAWWPLMRHMTCVARFGVGSRHLEENRAGRWVNVSARRPSLVMSFPIDLGTVLPLDLLVPREPAEGTERSSLLPGTLLYSIMLTSREAALAGEEAGELYMLLEAYDGQNAPECAQLLRKEKTGGAQGGASYFCDLGTKTRKGASLNQGRPWLPFARDLWVVNHFSRDRRSTSARPGQWSRLTFDFRSAEGTRDSSQEGLGRLRVHASAVGRGRLRRTVCVGPR